MKRLIVILAFCFLAGSGCGGALSTQPGVMALVDLIQYVVTHVVPAFRADKAYCDTNEKDLDIDEFVACTELRDAYLYVATKRSFAEAASQSGTDEQKETARAELQRAVDEFEKLAAEDVIRSAL